MGVTAFFYAAKAGLDTVEVALRNTWPELSLLLRDDVPALEHDDVLGRLSDDTGVRLVLWSDGEYSCWAECELGLCEADKLQSLSDQLGTVLVAGIGDHGGSYTFGVLRDGRTLRWIQNDALWTRGAPLAEEAGLAQGQLDDSGVELLWARFHLQPFFAGVAPFRLLRR
jgi:hypothetical protein